MKNNFFLLAVVLFFVQTAFSQMQPFGHLTVFSENADAFYLIINGEQMNDLPQTNIRVEELTNSYYHAKVIFEDQSLETISKNYMQIVDVDGIMSDVTYKIKRNKNKQGKAKMSFFSSVPVVQGYSAPANVYVRRFGDPVQETTVVQAQTTINNISINTNVNAQGENINVSVQNPFVINTVAETTFGGGEFYEEDLVDGCRNAYGMNSVDFNSAISTLKATSFDDTSLKIAKQITSVNCLTSNQIIEICNLLKFEENKLEFAKFAFNYCTEPQNYFKVNNVFNFSSSVEELNDFIHGN